MSFVSYAQNFEDVILWRALKHVEQGFYIDAGAWSPDADSVTKAFYERNWHGINIEPNPEFYRQLQDRRPRDINLQVALSDKAGELPMNFLSNPGLSTLDDSIAAKHKKTGWDVERLSVTVSTLASVWQENVPGTQDVHFLKIDVEGFEEAVLKGNDWSKFRPWIIVIEATLPMSQVENHETWEHILIAADYIFAYADGLNRFYVAEEHNELLASFNYPPNVFDCFNLSVVKETEDWAKKADVRANEAEARANKAEVRANEAEVRANEAERNYNSVLNSASWRITKPLRWISATSCRLVSRTIKIRSSIVPAFKRARETLRQKWKSSTLPNRFTKFAARWRHFVRVDRGNATHNKSTSWAELTSKDEHDCPSRESLITLPANARYIYKSLKDEIESRTG